MNIIENGSARPATPEEISKIAAIQASISVDDPSYTAPTRLHKADIWRRTTDAEAEQVDALLNAQPARLRRMWADATFLSSDDELFSSVMAGATALFGSARAAELLELTY